MNTLMAQDFNVVPKLKSLEAGYRYIGNTSLDIHPGGWTSQLDVAWQVSGFKEKRPSYISIPLGFGQFTSFGDDSLANATMLHYGWTIKHYLARDKKFIPFLNYSLLLNQLWLKGTVGHVIGHETRFDFGYEIHPENKKYFYLVKLEYSHLTFPALEQKKSDKLDVVSLKIGMGF